MQETRHQILSCVLVSATTQGQLENEQSEEGSIQTRGQTYERTRPWPHSESSWTAGNLPWDSPHRQISPVELPENKTGSLVEPGSMKELNNATSVHQCPQRALALLRSMLTHKIVMKIL